MSDFGIMKNEKDKWSNLVCQTISTLCRNGMIGSDVIKVQGLIGITLSNQEVFLVEISETFDMSMIPQSDLENSSLSRVKSRKRKNLHPRSSKIPDEATSHDGESNEAENDIQASNSYQQDFLEIAFTNSFQYSQGNCYDKNPHSEREAEKSEFQGFDAGEDPKSAVREFGSLAAATDEPLPMEMSPLPQRKFRRRDLSQGVAMTKHTAELLGYQEFSPASSRPYSCRLCESSFSKKFCLANHIVTVHQVGGKYICEHCGRQFLQRNRYMLHMDRHNDASKLVCPNCGKTTLKSNFDAHLKKCTSSSVGGGGAHAQREPGSEHREAEEEADPGEGDESGATFEMPGFLPDAKIKHERFELH